MVQIEQLHTCTTASIAASASKHTAPQWHPPTCVVNISELMYSITKHCSISFHSTGWELGVELVLQYRTSNIIYLLSKTCAIWMFAIREYVINSFVVAFILNSLAFIRIPLLKCTKCFAFSSKY